MNGNRDDMPSPVRLEDDRELWQLLGQARNPGAGPYFVRRVLRDTEELTHTRSASALGRGLRAWWQAGLPLLRPPRAAVWPGAAAALAICTVTVLTTFSGRYSSLPLEPATPWRSQAPVTSAAGASAAKPGQEEAAVLLADNTRADLASTASEEPLTSQDAEVIVDLDSLMAREETHLWTDDSATY